MSTTSVTGSAVSPKLGLRWHAIDKTWLLRAIAGCRLPRAQSMTDLYRPVTEGSTATLLADPRLPGRRRFGQRRASIVPTSGACNNFSNSEPEAGEITPVLAWACVFEPVQGHLSFSLDFWHMREAQT